jgi:hypothetical protein
MVLGGAARQLAKLPTALWPCKLIKTVYALSIGGSENGRWERWISGYQKVEGSLRVVQDEVGVWFETRDVVGMPRQAGSGLRMILQ